LHLVGFPCELYYDAQIHKHQGVRCLHDKHVLFSFLEPVFPTLQIISQTEVYDFFWSHQEAGFF
jgi:hypothetical protein